MSNKIAALIVAVIVTISMAGSAFAAFADLELIRVYYDRNGTEIATDLGLVTNLVNSSTPAGTPTNTIGGSFGSLTTGYAVYFALDRVNFDLWGSNSTTPPMVIGGNNGLTSITNGTTNMYTLFNTQGGTNYTGLASVPNSFKNKLSSTQGWLANTITGVASRAATELSLENIFSGNNTQILYYWGNAKAATADIAGRTGVAVATITTNADGSTTISPPPPPPPSAPTIGTATPGNAQATVTFTAPASDGGSAITGYTVTSIPGGLTGTGAASPITVTGLTNGVAYTFTVTASNTNGTGPASAASNSVIPTSSTVPDAPTIGTATPGNTQATVTFTEPASDGGSAITGYTVTSNPGGLTGTGSASPITVTGLTNGTAYTFTVTATNEIGPGPASGASNSVTPVTVPDAPTDIIAARGNAQATVSFIAPADGGSAITGYTATSNPGGLTGTGAASPVTVTGLSNGTAYTFTVTATNAVGTGPASAPSNSVTPATVPDQPTGVAATPGNSQATVAFIAPADGGSAITGYTITSTPGGFTGTGPTSPINVTGLTNGTAYTFTVTATNGVGTGPASTASNSVTPVTIPGAPTNIAATWGNAQATVAFTAPTDGGSAITGYTVTSSPDGKTASGTASPITVTGLTNGTTYTFTVTATNAKGTGPASAPSNSATPAMAPDAPTGAAATAGNSLATVTFSAPASNGGSAITGYTVTSNPAGGTDTNAGTPGTTHTITGLTNGTAYTFTVTATNIAGTSAASAASNSVTPSPAATEPSSPNIGVATAGNSQATVLFTAPLSDGGSAITGYTVTSNPAGGTDTNAGSTALSHIITGLTNGTAYTFTVTATNSIGTSPTSSQSNSVTPATLPGAPSISTATGGNAQATVTFTPPVSNGGSAISGYNVTSNPAGGTDTGAGSTSLSHIITGLTNGTAYTFTVTATNGVGTGPASAASISVTPVTVPGAPAIGIATSGNAQTAVAFTAPLSDGGSAITGYTVTSTPGGLTGTGTASPITVTGLTNGTTYTFTVTATNAKGTGPASAPSNSATPAMAPGAPTGAAATAGNSLATVTFSAPASNGGSAITGYTVTSNPAGGTDTNAGTPGTTHTITGLTNGTAYTFTVTATNIAGTSAASAASNSVTPSLAPTAPDAPTGVTATAGNTQASVKFNAPASNGNPITGYTVTSSPGGFTATGNTSPIIISGLSNGTAYKFTVTATNASGTSPASAASNSVTPTIMFDVTLNAVINDKIDSVNSQTQSVKSGDNATFTVKPMDGYKLVKVTGCGGTWDSTSPTYTTGKTSSNCIVSAEFAAITTTPKGHLTGTNLNPGETVTVGDALMALKMAVGLLPQTSKDLAIGDVAPIDKGVSRPDGKIDIADAVAILQKSVGLLNW